MLNALLPFIPTIIKSLARTKDAPEILEALNVPPANIKGNYKALLMATLALLAYYGVKVAPEWTIFLNALLPVIGTWAGLFLVSKPKAE